MDFDTFKYQAEIFFAKNFSFSLRTRITLYKKLANFLDQGIDIYRALQMVAARAQRTKDPLAPMYFDWLRKIGNGNDFSDAVEGWVPDDERMLIIAGERGAALANGIRMAGDVADRMSRIRKAVMGELATPLFLILAGVAILLFAAYSIVPGLEKAMPRKVWPDSLRNIGMLTDFVRNWGLVTLVLVGGLSAAVIASLGRWFDDLRIKLDHYLLPYPIYREFRAAGFLIALSALMSSGIDLAASIKIIRDRSNNWMRGHLNRILSRISAGEEPGEAFDTGLFNLEVSNDLKDFGRANKFESAIDELGRTASEDGAARIKKSAGLVRIVVMMLIAGGIVYGYSAIYELQDAAKANATKSQRK